jgi:U-box domain
MEPTTEIPEEFLCPLTMDLMQDPVLSRYGHSYERDAILEYLARGNEVCPCTRQPLRMRDIITNHQLRTKIRRWQIDNGESVTVIFDGNGCPSKIGIFGFVNLSENNNDATEGTEADEDYITEAPLSVSRHREATSRTIRPRLLRGLFRSRNAAETSTL